MDEFINSPREWTLRLLKTPYAKWGLYVVSTIIALLYVMATNPISDHGVVIAVAAHLLGAFFWGVVYHLAIYPLMVTATAWVWGLEEPESRDAQSGR